MNGDLDMMRGRDLIELGLLRQQQETEEKFATVTEVSRRTVMGDPPPMPPRRTPVVDRPMFESSDLGNAKRLVDVHGWNLHYVPQTGAWLNWNGTYWKGDLTGGVVRCAKEITEQLLDEARASKDEKAFRWAVKSQSAAGIRNMVALAESEPGIPVLVDQLDANDWLLTVANGTLDMKTGKLLPASRRHLITKSSPVRWDENATCPTWTAFLERILPAAELRHFYQKAIGYSLTGDVSEQVFFIKYGTGSNGKSVSDEAILHILGDHAKPAPPKLLLAKAHDEHPTAIADLQGRRLVVAHEVEDGLRLDEALVKQLTGSDMLKARYMRQDFFEFAPRHKLWLSCNHKPAIRGTDNGIWRRVRLIPFEVTIPDAERDNRLVDKLKAEAAGILRWAVDGCLAWQQEGLTPPAVVVNATSAYRQESDVLAQYIADNCITGDMFQVRSSNLYTDYKAWAADNGIKTPWTQKTLANRLTEKRFDRTENRQGQAVWLGIGLVDRSNGSAAVAA